MWTMTRYADPQRCPDCHGPLGPDDLACPACGLPLRGALAAELFRTLSIADGLLARLRESATGLAGARVTPAAVPGVDTLGGRPSAVPAPAGAPAPPATPMGPPRPHGLSAASVPRILLGLGALCLLVAALVFLAVTWSVMGVGARTATLVGLTVVAGLLATVLARRELRAGAEALSLVTLGLLALDLVGAENAGWLGDISTSAELVLLGSALAAAGAAAGLAARRTPVRALTAPEIVAGVGVLTLTAGVPGLVDDQLSLLLVVAVLVAGGLTWLAAQLRLAPTAALAGVAATGAWLAQLVDAALGVSSATWAALWVDAEVVALLVSAVLAAVPALVTALPTGVRVGAAATALAVLSVTVAVPALDESTTLVGVAGLVALVAVAPLAWFAPRPWGLTAALTQTLGGVTVLAALLAVAVVSGERLVEAGAQLWAGRTGDRLPATFAVDTPEPWLAVPSVLALLLTATALARTTAVLDAAVSVATDLRLGATLVAAAAVATLAGYAVPVWTVLLTLLVVAAAFLGWWWQHAEPLTLAPAVAFLGAATLLGLYDEWLTVLAATVLLVAAGAVHVRAATVELSAAAGAVAPVALAVLAWTWGDLAGGEGPWVGLAGLLLLAAVTLTLHLYPGAWWRCGAATAARTGVEVAAASVALPLGLAGVMTADDDLRATWTAVYLTVAGTAVIAHSLLRADRRLLSWPGSALLVLASWVRLGDLGVTDPEPYTLPSALALIAVGVLRLRRDQAADTLLTTGPGLALALVPSLVWALDEPLTLRGLLLGLACLGLVAVGVQGRWSAPLVAGAAVGAVLVVRMAAPYVDDAVPRWVLIGGAGALLIATGVTWERRLAEARHVLGYVRSLR